MLRDFNLVDSSGTMQRFVQLLDQCRVHRFVSDDRNVNTRRAVDRTPSTQVGCRDGAVGQRVHEPVQLHLRSERQMEHLDLDGHRRLNVGSALLPPVECSVS